MTVLLLFIGGKHKVKDMDAYMQPMVDELIKLWEGCLHMMHEFPLSKIGNSYYIDYCYGPAITARDY